MATVTPTTIRTKKTKTKSPESPSMFGSFFGKPKTAAAAAAASSSGCADSTTTTKSLSGGDEARNDSEERQHRLRTTTTTTPRTASSRTSASPERKNLMPLPSLSEPYVPRHLSGDVLPILVEVVGATGIHPPSPQMTRSRRLTVQPVDVVDSLLSQAKKTNTVANSYCRVKYGTEVVHRTRTIPASNNPIWAVDTGSICLLQVKKSDILAKDPAWRSSTRSLKRATPAQAKKMLTIEVKDRDTLLQRSTLIGTVTLDLPTVLKSCTEERLEFPIEEPFSVTEAEEEEEEEQSTRQPPDVNTSKSQQTPERVGSLDAEEEDDDDDGDGLGTLALRFRVATKADLTFLKELKAVREAEQGAITAATTAAQSLLFGGSPSDPLDSVALSPPKNAAHGAPSGPSPEGIIKKREQPALITEQEETAVGWNGMMYAIQFAMKSSAKAKDGKKRIRVKPGPDPDRHPEETGFLTEDEMREAAYAPSTRWIEAGSGDLGRVYVEILRCNGLPNLDTGGAVGNKTDSFAALVFEDTMVQTDVIDDELSPLWMPWTQRAFALQWMHPLSYLYIGVYDYDLGPMGHEGIGRVAINLTNFVPGTSYTLQYNLYPSSFIVDREALGTITIRLRVEINDEKAFLLASRTPPPRVHVNVTKEKSLSVAKFACYGKYDQDQYDMKLLKGYVNEILAYKRIATYSISDAIPSLIFWRGQVRVGNLKLPLHSAIAFFSLTYVVEHPSALPAYYFFCFGWFMLANFTNRNNHPNPWNRPTSILRYSNMLLSDVWKKCAENETVGTLIPCSSPPRGEIIAAGVGVEETKIFEEAWEERQKADQEEAAKKYELQQEVDAAGDEQIETKEKGIQIDPLRRLFPYQLILRGVAERFRSMDMVIRWEEGMTSFWMMAFSFGISIVLFILPTAFILRWIIRILIWCFLGPWMKFVDVFVLGNEPDRDVSCAVRREEEKTVKFKKLVAAFRQKTKAARVKGEEAVKLKAMRILRFGKYIAKVPDRYLTRHHDKPQGPSIAEPFVKEKHFREECFEKRRIIDGQKLDGVIVPRPLDVMKDEEEAAAAQKLLSELMGEKPEAEAESVVPALAKTNVDESVEEGQLDEMSVEVVGNAAARHDTILTAGGGGRQVSEAGEKPSEGLNLEGIRVMRQQDGGEVPGKYQSACFGYVVIPPKPKTLEGDDEESVTSALSVPMSVGAFGEVANSAVSGLAGPTVQDTWRNIAEHQKQQHHSTAGDILCSEEGLEVVPFDAATVPEEEEHLEFMTPSQSVAPSLTETLEKKKVYVSQNDDGLSLMYRKSDRVYVARYKK